MNRTVSVLLAILALSLPARAAEVTTFTLDNGLEVVVLEDHRAAVVVHMVWYRVGAADEPPGKSGIAHFLEHLLFKGTDDLGPGEFSATVTKNGGSDNAFTSQDYTAYFQRIASDRLELVMTMEADRMRDLEMAEDDVVTERQVVLEERGTRVDSDPGSLFREQLNAAQNLNHPYGIPVIGWRHEMEQLNRDDAFAFYQRYYAPNNAILIVAGDVDPAEVKTLAEKYYGPLAPTANLPERARPQDPPHLSERRLTLADPRFSQPFVTRSYRAPERDSGDQFEAAKLVMLAEVLGGSAATSVLGQKLQFETEQAIFTSASYRGVSLDDTTFGLVIAPTPDLSLAEAEAALDNAIAEFMAEGVDAEQFDSIKMQLRASLIFGEDSVSAQANRYGAALTSGLTVEDILAWPDLLQTVTAEDVLQAARDIFNKDNAVTGWAMPATQKDTQ